MNRSISSGRTSGPRSLISVCSPEVGSTTARFVRDSPSIAVYAFRIGSPVSRARMRVPVEPPARPVAITGRPSSFRARATLTPFPPANVRDSTARWRFPRRKLGTATVRSIAALRVTVRITSIAPCGPLSGPLTLLAPGAERHRGDAYHDREGRRREDPHHRPWARDRVVDASDERAPLGDRTGAPRDQRGFAD